jgi:hypothetical protein
LDNPQKVSPAIKELLNKQMPNLAELEGSIIPQPVMTASTILKQIDSTFESFFHKRDYTERNFSFYLQVLAQQYKPVEAQAAFEKMLTLGIKPSDQVFTQLMLSFAKTKNL